MPTLNLLFTATDNAQPSVRNLISSLSDLGNAYRAGMEAARKFASMAASPMKEAFRFQTAATRLAPLVGGLENARELSAKLRDEATRGTQTLETLTATAGKLASVFNSTSSVEKWTSAFHNLSAGLGRDVNELVENFVKAKASGRFEAGFLDMFAAKGVNLFEDLQAQTGKTEKELRAMATSGELSFDKIERAILKTVSAGGKFEGQASALSNTTGGAIATLSSQWSTLQAQFAEPIADALTPVLQNATAFLERISPLAKTVGDAFSAMFNGRLQFGLGVGAIGGFASLFSGLPSGNEIASVRNAFASLSARARVLSADFSLLGARGLAATAAQMVVVAVKTRLANIALAACGFAVRALKTAVVSTGIGLIFIGIGEAVAFLIEKISQLCNAEKDAEEIARAHSRALKEIKNSFKDCASVADVLAEKERQLNALDEEREDLIADSALSYEDFKKRLDNVYERIESVRKQAWIREAEILEAERRAEITAAAQRAKSAAEKIQSYEAERDALSQTASEKIATIEKIAGAEASEMRKNIASKKELSHLSEKESATVERQLDALKKIDAIEQARDAAKKSIESRIELLRAEIESEEKLAKVKEKQYAIDLRAQFLAAGYSPADAEKRAQEYIRLEKLAESKREQRTQAKAETERRERAQETISAEEKENERLRAQVSGDALLAQVLEIEQKKEEHIDRLLSSGVDLETAYQLAAERSRLEQARDEASKNIAAAESVNRSQATIWKNGRIISGNGNAAAANGNAIAPAQKNTERNSAQTVSSSVFAAFLDIQKQIRDNTAATVRGLSNLSLPRGAILA